MNAFPHSSNAPTNATQAKDRLYAQLSSSLSRMSRAVGQTADLCEQLQVDLHAMRTFAGLDAAKLMTVAAKLNADDEDSEREAAQDSPSGCTSVIFYGTVNATCSSLRHPILSVKRPEGPTSALLTASIRKRVATPTYARRS
ncbi:hypothetical protein C8R47DRAFT_1192675 [Mycena vitilis]|nr:hypothetical protein C8R47DRAFT_1192675 [Mycena vitilis]